MDNINIEAIRSYIKSIFSKLCNIEAIRSYIKSMFSKLYNIEAIRSYIKSKQKRIGAALVLICLSIGYALTLGNVISIEPSLENCIEDCETSIEINYKELYIYSVLSFYAFACAGLFFNELSKHKDL